MYNPNDQPKTSEGGITIYSYEKEKDWAPAVCDSNVELITDHIEKHLGPVKNVIHEIASDTVHVDIHIVDPTDDFPFYRLITSGMSDLAMTVPNPDFPRFAELIMTLPASWDLNSYNDQDNHRNWPVSLLRYLARFPHKYESWLGWGHTIPNGNPPTPFDESLPFCGSLIYPSITAPKDFHKLTLNDSQEIHFFAVIPLYKSEMDFKLKHGTDALLELFDKHNVNDIFISTRKSVTNKPWWKIW